MGTPNADAKVAAFEVATNDPSVTMTLAAQASKPVLNSTSGGGAQARTAPGKTPSGEFINAGRASNMRGAGGKATCRLAIATPTGPDPRDYVDFELGPARRSFYDKQGQAVPGAGAGLEQTTKTSIAKLLVAGSTPIYQAMGIAEETIEFVGAFVAWDDPYSDMSGGKTGNQNAWEKSQRLAVAVRSQREMMLVMEWTFPNGKKDGVHALKYSSYNNEDYFKGYVKSVTRAYAHAQRVYYRIVFCLTNRQALYNGKESSLDTPLVVPFALVQPTDDGASPTRVDPDTDTAPSVTTPEPAATGATAPKTPGQPVAPAVAPANKPRSLYKPTGEGADRNPFVRPVPTSEPQAPTPKLSALPTEVAAYYADINTTEPDVQLIERYLPEADPAEIAVITSTVANMQAGVPAKGTGTNSVPLRTAMEVRGSLQAARVAATQAGDTAAADHFRGLEERGSYHLASLSAGVPVAPKDVTKMQVRERRLESLVHQLGGTEKLMALPIGTVLDAFDFPDEVIAVTHENRRFEIPDLELVTGYLVFDDELDLLYTLDISDGLTSQAFGTMDKDVVWFNLNPPGATAFLMYQTVDDETRTLKLIRA